jgi:hypothetical protein
MRRNQGDVSVHFAIFGSDLRQANAKDSRSIFAAA